MSEAATRKFFANDPSFIDDIPWVSSEGWGYYQYSVRDRDDLKIAQARVDLTVIDLAQLETRLFYGFKKQYRDEDGSFCGFHGLSDYYNTCDKAIAQNAVNVIDAQSETDSRTSLWVVGWGEQSVCMVSSDGKPLKGSKTAACALLVKDWRYASRVANIDVDVVSRESLLSLMDRAIIRFPKMMPGKGKIYCSAAIADKLAIGSHRGMEIKVISTLHSLEDVVK